MDTTWGEITGSKLGTLHGGGSVVSVLFDDTQILTFATKHKKVSIGISLPSNDNFVHLSNIQNRF